jgi:hypothetical protein
VCAQLLRSPNRMRCVCQPRNRFLIQVDAFLTPPPEVRVQQAEVTDPSLTQTKPISFEKKIRGS